MEAFDSMLKVTLIMFGLWSGEGDVNAGDGLVVPYLVEMLWDPAGSGSGTLYRSANGDFRLVAEAPGALEISFDEKDGDGSRDFSAEGGATLSTDFQMVGGMLTVNRAEITTDSFTGDVAVPIGSSGTARLALGILLFDSVLQDFTGGISVVQFDSSVTTEVTINPTSTVTLEGFGGVEATVVPLPPALLLLAPAVLGVLALARRTERVSA